MTAMANLANLTPIALTSNRTVMRVGGEGIKGKQFASSVALNYQRLVAMDAEVVAIYSLCSYQFTIALFAALHAQKDIIILPNVQPGFIDSIANDIDLLISDEKVCEPIPYCKIEEGSDTEEYAEGFAAIPASSSLSFFTSGSTGIPGRIHKTLQQITDELDVLTSVWPAEAELQGKVYTTVSHQHLYGFTFALMWPLVLGRVVDARQYHYPEPLMAELEGDTSATLISSPALLNRMGQLIDVSLLEKTVSSVFSAGGPLNSQAALEISEFTDHPVREIFGSTETGVVAYRSQHENTEAMTPWTLFPNVAMQCNPDNQCLMVDSPYADGSGWYEMGDTVELLSNQQFILKHRIDKIVKVEEKRLSLTEMETVLTTSSLVDSCVCAVSGDKRRIVVSVVVLTEQGKTILDQQNKHSLNQILRSHLLEFFEAVLVPKKWRYVEALPLNSQGKITVAAIEDLFAVSIQLDSPDISAVEHQDDTVVMQLVASKDLRYFDGHFDSKPILPGVVQVDWAAKFGQQYFDIEGSFQRLEVIKFHEFIEPDTAVELTLNHQPDKHRIVFQFASSKGVHSSGRIVFG